MFLKHYTAVPQMVPDPMHPGRAARITRLVDSGVSVHAEEDRVYEADTNGWFDFPQEVAERLRSFRNRGSGWFGQAEVADQIRLGTLDQMDRPAPKADEPVRRGPGRPRKVESEEVG